MRSQRRLRDDLRFVTEFNTLFDVVQQAAVSHLRRLDEALAGQPAVAELLQRDFFPLLPAAAASHRLIRGGAGARLIAVITSDEGLVGPLHTAVVREAQRQATDSTEWLLIGQRGLRLLGKAPASARVVPIPPDERVGEQMQRIAQFILTRYRQANLKDVWIAAPRFISAARQEVAMIQVLPLPFTPSLTAEDERQMILEPSLARIVERLGQRWVDACCTEAFWSARRAEFAARAMHVESSRQELAKRSRIIRHEFFKTMHERVDVMVRETCVVQRHVTRTKERAADANRAMRGVG